MIPTNSTPQIKICGLTKVDEAVKCAELGANAIGLIFYDKSPRLEKYAGLCPILFEKSGFLSMNPLISSWKKFTHAD